MMMNSVAGFEDWQLSKLDQFLEVTNMHDVEEAVSVLKSLNWDIEKAIEEHLLDNLENLSTSTSSSASDFVIIDRNSLSNKELTSGFVDVPGIVDDPHWEAVFTASLPEVSSDSDDSCEVISINEGKNVMSYADVVKTNINDIGRQGEQKVAKQCKVMATMKPNSVLGALVTETLVLDRSLNFESGMNEMEAMEMRIRKMMSDKETISELLPALNEYMRMKSKLALCLHLLLDSASIVTDVKSNILNGKLVKAYKNFIKYEKCRNDLLELIDNDNIEQEFVLGYFDDVELMAIQIRDVIRLTLVGAAAGTTHNNGNNPVDGGDSGFSNVVLQQIMQIIDCEAKLDSDNEMRKEKGLKGFLNRPRNWRSLCLSILNDQLQRGVRGPVEAFTKQLLEHCLDIDDGTGDLGEDTAYREELLAMKKYFKETRLRETEFLETVAKYLEAENVFEQASDYITNGNLLSAVEKLLKAESIRYHLLAVAKSQNDYDAISKLLVPYYKPLEQIYAKFINEAKYYCTRGIDIMRGKDLETKKQLEVVLRAVEIDEKVDKLYENSQFRIENRPHCWRKIFFKIVEERVQQRVEAFQIEDRKLNKNWVTRNLEICRLYIVEDLYAAKHFLRIFPKEHQLYNNFVMFYHNGIANKISEMSKGELNKRELVQLLSWIRQYPGEHMLGMTFLEIDAVALAQDKPLIERNELLRLFEMFVEIMKSETAKWALKTVKQEFAEIKELKGNIMEDENEYYYTHLPHILYSIVNDQMTLACEISDEIVPRVLNECLHEYIRLIIPYLEDSVIELKNKGLDQKEHNEDYTKTMIAVANNLDMCAESTEKLKKYIEGMVADEAAILNRTQLRRKRISTGSIGSSTTAASAGKQRHKHLNRKMQGAIHGAVNALREIPATLASIRPSSSESVLDELGSDSKKQVSEESDVEIELEDEEPLAAAWERIEILKTRFSDMLQIVMSMLCDEIYNDLYNYFDQLLSKQWLKDPSVVGTICETVKDYENDYKHLRHSVHIEALRCIEFKIVAEYLNAIASRKLTCTEFRKRCAIAKCLENDVATISRIFDPLFAKLCPAEEVKNLTDVLLSIAEFITLRDKSMLSLETASLLRKYPEMTQEFLFSLIDIRDDMTSSESRALTDDCVKMIDRKESEPEMVRLFQAAKGERKTSQIIKDVVPRLRRRVRLSIANQ